MVVATDGGVECATPARPTDAMSAVEIVPETQKHPFAVMLMLGFKASPIVAYVTCEVFNKNFVHNFVAVVILLAGDFWITKNIGGRLLVGLRYWNEIDEAGESRWRFESRDEDGMKRVDKHESRLFWTTLYVAVLVWVVFFIGTLAAFHLNYALLSGTGLILASSNLYGYYACSKDQQAAVAAGMSSFARRQVVGSFFS